MKTKLRKLVLGLLLLAGFTSLAQTETPSPKTVLFQNVRIFDGKTGRLSGPSYVVVRGNKIERISATPLATDQCADTVLIDGGGRTLMPGLIDMHWHAMLVRPSPASALRSDIGYTNLVAGALADLLLVDGNPIEHIQLIEDPAKNFLVIMKDGKIYKNSTK